MTLVLDPDIRDWVVLPLFVIIVVTGLLRQEVSRYLQAQAKKVPIPPHVQRIQSRLQFASQVRNAKVMTNVMISPAQWTQYKQAMLQELREEIQLLEQEKEKDTGPSSDPMEMMLSNPLGMMGGNMIFMVQNMVMMQGIQHFFSGFILLQVPFSLTIGFKSMFQKGVVDLPNLSSSYVSSVSWYFLVLYGLRSFFKLLIGTPSYEHREQELFLSQSMGYQNPPNPAGPKQDIPSLITMINSEIDQLDLFMIPSAMTEIQQVESRLLGPQRYPKKALANSARSVGLPSPTDVLFSISQAKLPAASKAAVASSKKKQ
jgi:ER membrane protein complex subunit 3